MYIFSNFAEVSHQPEFLALESIKVQQYFTEVMKVHGINHDTVLYLIMSWASHDPKNRLADLENFLYFQLPSFSPDAICGALKKHRIRIMSNMNIYKLYTKALEQTHKPKLMPFIVGGHVGEKVSCVAWNLNKSTKCVELPSLLTKHHSACKCPHGFAITGGEDSDVCMMFNASTKSWSTLQKMLRKRKGHGSLYLTNVLHVFGGRVNGVNSKSVDYLPLEDGTWQCGVDLPIAVYGPKVADINNNVYLLDTITSKQLLKLDLEKKVWDRLASLPIDDDCLGVSMAVLNDKLYVVGGLHRICAWYDTTTNTWSKGQKPGREHFHGSLLVLDNTLLILGGRYSSLGTDEVEELNLAAGSWSVSNIKMPASLYLHHTIVLKSKTEFVPIC